MLKPKPKTNPLILWGGVGALVLAGIILLIVSFSRGNNELDQVNAAYTSAAETLSAQQLTLQAASPTVTPTLETPTPSLTPTLFVTNTLPVLVSPTTSTGGTTGGGSGAVGCDNSVYVADVTIPDKTAMTAGQTFVKTWKLQNTGTCPWTTSYSVTFLSGNQMSGKNTPLTVAVQPGQSGDVSVSLVAPTTAGTAIGYWRLSNASGVQFGTSFYVEIVVGGASPTATTGAATATSTTGAPAPTATFTTAPPSATPEPTNTP
jgi:hypothetical protein